MQVAPSIPTLSMKIIVIGNVSTGKTTLIRHCFDCRTGFPPTGHTIGCDLASGHVFVWDSDERCQQCIRVAVWDTAGMERFRSPLKSLYRCVAGVVLMFDICDRSTFHALASWIVDVRKSCSMSTLSVLVGNKIDLSDERQVSYEEANEFAKSNSMPYYELSALKPHIVPPLDYVLCEPESYTSTRHLFTQLATSIYDERYNEKGDLKEGITRLGRTWVRVDAVEPLPSKTSCCF